MVKSNFIWSDLGSFDSLIAYAHDFDNYELFQCSFVFILK